MIIVDKTWTSEDEGYNTEGKIATLVKQTITEAGLDTYNNEYVFHFTVHRVDPKTPTRDRTSDE